MLDLALLILILLVVAVFIVPVALTVRFVRLMLWARRTFQIPVHPALIETRQEHVPPELAIVLAEVTPALERLGFSIAANMHAEMSYRMTWTHVLFVHRERGDRAGVMYLRREGQTWGRQGEPGLVFATEPAGADTVKTQAAAPMDQQAVIELYDRHRRDVEAQFAQNSAGSRGILPESGREAEWMAQRAASIAASVAKSCSFVQTGDGECYRPTWRLAARSGWRTLRKRRPDRGFEVIVNPSQSSPDSRLPDDV